LREESENVLVVDGGNLLTSAGIVPENGRESIERNAGAIIESQKTMGIDAGNVGYKDAAMGIKYLEKTAAGGYPWVSANLRTKAGKLTKIPPYRIVKVGQINVGIFGLLDEKIISNIRNSKQIDYSVADPVRAAEVTIKELKKKDVDIIVLLSGLIFVRSKELLQNVEGINLLVNGGDSRMLKIPERVGKSLLFGMIGRGKYLGVAHLGIAMDNLDFQVEGENVDIQGRLRLIAAQKRIYEGEIATLPEVKEKINELQAQEKELKSRLSTADRPASVVRNQLVPLDRNIPGKKSINDILQKAKNKSRK